jgi:acetyl-CoA carboxylase biotin carboxyl carrier protein
VDAERIRQLIALARTRRVGELEISEGQVRVSFRFRSSESGGAEPCETHDDAPPAAASGSDAAQEHWVRSPMVGLFRGQDGAAASGTAVAPGDVIGHVESMGILNEVASDVSGIVKTVEVEDGDPVEYGQGLVLVSTGKGTESEVRE